MLCNKFELIPSSNFQVMSILGCDFKSLFLSHANTYLLTTQMMITIITITTRNRMAAAATAIAIMILFVKSSPLPGSVITVGVIDVVMKEEGA